MSAELVPPPARGRVFRSSRRIRLSDTDATGRLRLDAVARYLQDVATDDVADNGSGSPDDLWIVRRTVVHVVEPFAGDGAVELATWCSGVGSAAAARRTSIAGDGGGRIEAETIWIHLDREQRPARLASWFHEIYGEACGGRRASTRLELPDPPADAARRPWPLRATDVDVMGHVNNAAYWEAVEEAFAPRLGGRLVAVLEYRAAIDPGERVELVTAGDRAWLAVGRDVRAAAAVDFSA
jgi:acyl-ACP thioesterase